MPKKGSKIFIIEARRLIPILFLLVLLLSLTVYDNFFRAEPTAGLPERAEKGITFTTTDLGPLTSPTSFTLVADYEQWARVSQDLGLALPDYPFNAAEELAVFAINSEIQQMEVLPRFGEVEVRVLVEPKDNFYHVITVDRSAVDHEGAVWKFVDNQDRVLSRIIPFWRDKSEGDKEKREEIEEK